jgi:GNAT superfamily N-acetyltransferase
MKQLFGVPATVHPALLRDGTPVLIRPLRASDRDAYLDTFDRISEQSRHRRFLGPKPRLSPAEVRYFTQVDHHHHEALVAIDPGTGLGMGVARFIRDSEHPEMADAAIIVVDAAQGRGLGGVLFGSLMERARDEGVELLLADVAEDNRRMLSLLVHRGARARASAPDPGVRHLELPLSA